VTMNEYVEIANNYSTSRSGQFVNGILYAVVTYLEKEGLLKKN
ncbi:MAG: transcription antitermination factor NusB, partial [Muribaculaceae bacterium]|nr:transcription antitermination factor NusB [Muribaculaceae bacterium]